MTRACGKHPAKQKALCPLNGSWPLGITTEATIAADAIFVVVATAYVVIVDDTFIVFFLLTLRHAAVTLHVTLSAAAEK